MDYRVARSLSAPYPEKLSALHEIGKFDEIIAQREQHADVALTSEHLRYVGRAYLRAHAYALALPLLVDALDFVGLGQLIAVAPREFTLIASAAQFAVLSITGNWAEAMPYIQGRALPCVERHDAELTAWVVGNKEALDLALMRAISRSDSIVELPWDAKREPATQRPFAEYLLRTFVPKDRPIVTDVHVVELGAAIERSGNRMASLRFYEAVRDDAGASKERRRHARERWIVCKERQAHHAGQEKDGRAAAAHHAEAKKERDVLGVRAGDKLDAYPRLDSMTNYLGNLLRAMTFTEGPAASEVRNVSDPAEGVSARTASVEGVADGANNVVGEERDASAASAIVEPARAVVAQTPRMTVQKLKVGELDFEFFPATGRLNINGTGGVALSVRLGKRSCTSADLAIVNDGERVARFVVEEWRLVVDMGDPRSLLIELAGENLHVRFIASESYQ